MSPLRRVLAAVLIAAATTAGADEPVPPTLIMPVPDAERGRQVFGAKGCVVCHAVNGVGGNAGPALDGENADNEIDPLDFAARMWRGARAMSVLQSMQFGYQIQLTGAEIADLAAFVASEEERALFSDKDVPWAFRNWSINVSLDGDGMSDADGEVSQTARGYVLAERWCAACHAVLRTGDYGVAGPAFAQIAEKPGLDANAIRDWLSQPHEKMPEILGLTEANIDDIAAYILSMRP